MHRRRFPPATPRTRRAAAVFGVVALSLAAFLAFTPPGAASQPDDPPTNGFAPAVEADLNTYTGEEVLHPECPNGLAGTPGSDPATKWLDTARNTADSFAAGGTVHYVYGDNARDPSDNFEIQDCVVAYPADSFEAADFDANGVLVPDAYAKRDFTKGGTQLDAVTLTGIEDSTAPVYYRWTSPSDLEGGTWVCNFARDISTGHGGDGNRKVLPTCYQVPFVKATTALTTNATAAITTGQTATDVATLTGATSDAAGTITFDVYGTDDCTGTALFTSTKTVAGNGDYTSDAFEPTAVGTYYWKATYSGDAKNAGATHACGIPSEITTVTAAPALTLTVVKTNDANDNDTYTDNETAPAVGAAVPFRAVVTNPSTTTTVMLTSLTDQWPGQAPMGVTCSPAVTLPYELAPGASVTCDFTLAGYAPAAGTSVTDTVVAGGHEKDEPTNLAGGQDTSVVRSPAREVVIVIEQPTTTTVPPTVPTTTPTTVPPTVPTTTIPELPFTPDPDEKPAVEEPEVIEPEVLPVTHELPFTGSRTSDLVAAGLGLLGLGAVLVAFGPRRRTTS